MFISDRRSFNRQILSPIFRGEALNDYLDANTSVLWDLHRDITRYRFDTDRRLRTISQRIGVDVELGRLFPLPQSSTDYTLIRQYRIIGSDFATGVSAQAISVSFRWVDLPVQARVPVVYVRFEWRFIRRGGRSRLIVPEEVLRASPSLLRIQHPPGVGIDGVFSRTPDAEIYQTEERYLNALKPRYEDGVRSYIDGIFPFYRKFYGIVAEHSTENILS